MSAEVAGYTLRCLRHSHSMLTRLLEELVVIASVAIHVQERGELLEPWRADLEEYTLLFLSELQTHIAIEESELFPLVTLVDDPRLRLLLVEHEAFIEASHAIQRQLAEEPFDATVLYAKLSELAARFDDHDLREEELLAPFLPFEQESAV